MNTTRILLLEDSASDAELITRTLQRAKLQFTSRVEENAHGFHTALRDFAPDLVLTDYNLPTYDGGSAIRYTREHYPDIPVIVVTGALGDEKVVQLLHDGAMDFVLKDRMSRLPDAVKHALQEITHRAERKRDEIKLVERNELLRQAERIAHLGSWIWNLQSHHAHYSEEALNLLGLSTETIITEPLSLLVQHIHPHDREHVIAGLATLHTRNEDYEDEIRIVRPDGETRWAHCCAMLVRDSAGAPLKLIGTLLDITERKLAKLDTENNLMMLQMALDGAQESVWEWDMTTGTTKFSSQFYTMLGYQPDAFPATQEEWLNHVHPDDREHLRATLQDELSQQQDSFITEFRMLTKDGQHRWIQGRGKCIRFNAAGKPLKMVGVNLDIDERKKMEHKIRYLAYHDKLTGLPNRSLFFDRFSHALSQAKRDMTHVALLFADLDGFKQVNDQLGHEAGDEVLKMSAQRLLACVREADTVVRFGGDEFAIILSDLESAEHATIVAEKVITAFSATMHHANGVESHVGVSVGISVFPLHATTMDGLLSASDQAMYASKQAGKNTYRFFTGGYLEEQVVINIDAIPQMGISKIDAEHRNLAEQINQLHAAWRETQASGTTLAHFDTLIAATRAHFATEETYSTQCGYPHQTTHEDMHHAQIEELLHMRNLVADGNEQLVIHTIKHWLLDHIDHADRSLATFLIGKGVT